MGFAVAAMSIYQEIITVRAARDKDRFVPLAHVVAMREHLTRLRSFDQDRRRGGGGCGWIGAQYSMPARVAGFWVWPDDHISEDPRSESSAAITFWTVIGGHP